MLDKEWDAVDPRLDTRPDAEQGREWDASKSGIATFAIEPRGHRR